MATMKQVFGNMKKGLSTGNFTLTGLVQTLQHYCEDLENASEGGGGGSDYKRDVLTLETGDQNTVTLAHPITDYDQIILIGRSSADGADTRCSAIYDATYLTSLIGTSTRVGVTSDGWFTWYSFSDASTMAKSNNSWMWLECVIGIKF